MSNEVEQIKQIKEKYKEEFFAKANVVAVGIGFKYIGSKKTNELSIVVSVSRKVAKNDLAKQDLVPEKIDDIKTDVVETGLIRAITYDPTEKFRPAPGGVSIGHKDVTAGTLGITVLHQESSPHEPDESYCSIFGFALVWPISKGIEVGKVYILSNNHVLANSNKAELGDPIYQPGPYDGGGPNDTIALLSSFIPIKFNGEPNKVDCALAEPVNLSDVAEWEILEIGKISGTAEAQLGMNVRKYGRTTQLTIDQIIQIHATADVIYPDGQIARFEDQIFTGIMSSGGDSGSLLVEQYGQRAVGLLFAGSSVITVFNRIADVEEALNIKL